MDERLRLLASEKMTPLCREFGISRTTSYKIFNRHLWTAGAKPEASQANGFKM